MPLQGILVVSLEQAVAAPLCSARLAEAGARVVKIERPEGDFARSYDRAAGGQASYFVWLNRGKESVVLDIKDPADRRILDGLLARADVFIQNLAPGAADRAGLGSKELRRLYPQLICCNISGYGREGPYADRKAYDLLLQAETGLASVTGRPEGPGRVGVSVCDIACGMNAHAAILEALIARGRTDEGATIDVSLFDSLADWMTVPLLQYEGTGIEPARVGLHHVSIAPYGVYPCRGGASLLVAIQNEREWRRFCTDVLQQPGLADDPRFSSNTDRVAHRSALDLEIRDIFDAIDRGEIVDRLTAAEIAFGSVNSVADFAGHPQLRRITVETEAGPVAMPAPPVRSTARATRTSAVPRLGEHSDAIRREFDPDTQGQAD